MKTIDHSLFNQLKNLVQSERKITAEIVECIRQIDNKKLYLQWGHTSIYALLTEEFGYTPSSAQRRIDAARMSQHIPHIQSDLKSGDLNLTQVSMLAQSVRQKRKEQPKAQVKVTDMRDLLDQVKARDLVETQKTFARGLDLEIKAMERKTHQKDESVRFEVTFTKEQMEILNRVREVSSHQTGNSNLNELVMFLADQFLKRKDPAREVKMRRIAEPKSTTVPVVRPRQVMRFIGAKERRSVFQRDGCCQWKDHRTGEICGSKFRLQVDHRKPVWAGGTGEIENLQLLCSTHNRLKYEWEMEQMERAPTGSNFDQSCLASSGNLAML